MRCAVTSAALQGGSSKLASSALCLAFDSAHSQLWVGDSKVNGRGLVPKPHLHVIGLFVCRVLCITLVWTACQGNCTD